MEWTVNNTNLDIYYRAEALALFFYVLMSFTVPRNEPLSNNLIVLLLLQLAQSLQVLKLTIA